MEKVPGASASVLLNKNVPHIKDMDEATTDAEFAEAISRVTERHNRNK